MLFVVHVAAHESIAVVVGGGVAALVADGGEVRRTFGTAAGKGPGNGRLGCARPRRGPHGLGRTADNYPDRVSVLDDIVGGVREDLAERESALPLDAVKSMAAEWGPAGIRVNSVAPGSTMTPNTPPLGEVDARPSIIPLRRRGEALDIAMAIRFLMSDHARYVTGLTVP